MIGELKIVEGVYNSTLITKYEDHFEVEYFLEKKGYYFLEIYANNSNDRNYEKIITYKLICESDADDKNIS